jgi:cell division septation protein DedD
MKRWEFLIQKEGALDWVSLQESNLELEEGRYRVVARANRVNIDIEIRVIYQCEQGDRSQQSYHKYFRCTNAEGLVMVLPFTEFKAGTWTIRCCADILSELVGEFWQESIEIKVNSAIEMNKTENVALSPCFDSSPYVPLSPVETERIASPVTNSKAKHYLQQLEHLLQQEIEPMMTGFKSQESLSSQAVTNQLSVITPQDEKAISNSHLHNASKLASQELSIALEQDTFVRTRGEAIAISGRIERRDGCNSIESVMLGKLLYELRNPQTGEVCINFLQSLPETTLPYEFYANLEIPSEWEISFLLGTVILETSSGLVAVRQPFIVTTDVNKTSDSHSTSYAIALPNAQEELVRKIDYLLAQEASSTPLNLNLPEPNKMTKKFQQTASRASRSQADSGHILPPQLNRCSEAEAIKLQLPPLPKPPQKATVTTKEITSQKNTLVEEAFQALQLKERFLVRLGSLAKPASQNSLQLPKL